MLKAGLLGYPIDHSLSPAIHVAAYEALELDWRFDLYPCEDRAAFTRILAEAKSAPQEWVGFNVTTPYKFDAFEASSGHSKIDTLAGNVNVLTFSQDATKGAPTLKGANTDGRGLLAALKRQLDVELAGATVVLCGTGPVATSTLLALAKQGAGSVAVVSRNPAKGLEVIRKLFAAYDADRRMDMAAQLSKVPISQIATQLALLNKKMEKDSPFPKVEAIGYDEVAPYLERADILIDATSLGMSPGDVSPVPSELLRPGLAVFDVVYGHGQTALIEAARKVGANCCDGVGMLVEQAALTIEIWAREQGIRIEAPRELMYEVAHKELVGRK